MSIRHDYIKYIFTDLKAIKQNGIFLSGCGYSKKEGEYKRWSILNSDNLYIHCFYKNDVLDGEYKEWHDNGQLFMHCFYKKGLREGEYKEFDEKGQLSIHHLYKKGKEIKDYLK